MGAIGKERAVRDRGNICSFLHSLLEFTRTFKHKYKHTMSLSPIKRKSNANVSDKSLRQHFISACGDILEWRIWQHLAIRFIGSMEIRLSACPYGLFPRMCPDIAV